MGRRGRRQDGWAGRCAPAVLLAPVVLALLLLLPRAAAAQECRLALLLALDVSASVDTEEYALQRDGLAAALNDPDIRQVILLGGAPVALAAYEWSGRYQQAVILPWMMLGSDADIDRAVARIGGATRSHEGFPTAAGYALGYAAGLLAEAPPCDRQVIDVSGDGINNEGFSPALAYAHFPLAEVTVNGLAVSGPDSAVVSFYEGELIRGPGAFVQVAQGFADFRRAMTLKLFRELNDMRLGSAGGTRCCG
ncbi:Protein of unknown function [Pseudooceanicola antarcticus]|uniref:DUF1194 domain-containing protein n=1 Tax=Pseudooceanicola antarcticus TaxID=1247613 RepID=A0A285IRZ5_9RHOB|nr:DUF1194 domain-containing protein [Pseudooceanicola antarcticus]PJE31906.1 DUF1194 domain-containing protein [Pseudooceanicola antarcticus]SNY50790.1 Protein of unknown function [Pseudooceanicola antarcticus]